MPQRPSLRWRAGLGQQVRCPESGWSQPPSSARVRPCVVGHPIVVRLLAGVDELGFTDGGVGSSGGPTNSPIVGYKIVRSIPSSSSMRSRSWDPIRPVTLVYFPLRDASFVGRGRRRAEDARAGESADPSDVPRLVAVVIFRDIARIRSPHPSRPCGRSTPRRCSKTCPSESRRATSAPSSIARDGCAATWRRSR